MTDKNALQKMYDYFLERFSLTDNRVHSLANRMEQLEQRIAGEPQGINDSKDKYELKLRIKDVQGTLVLDNKEDFDTVSKYISGSFLFPDLTVGKPLGNRAIFENRSSRIDFED